MTKEEKGTLFTKVVVIGLICFILVFAIASLIGS